MSIWIYPDDPEDMRGWSDRDLCAFCYDYAVGTAEYEHYYRMEQPTHINLCYRVAKDELAKRGVHCTGTGGVKGKAMV